MIRKVFMVAPMVCPECGCQMKIVAFITEDAVVDRIMEHLKLTFVAAKPPKYTPPPTHPWRVYRDRSPLSLPERP